MIYNDSQLFLLTRAELLGRNDELQEEVQKETMAEKTERLRSLGYTFQEAPKKATEVAPEKVQEVEPLKVKNGAEVTKDGVSYFVKESYVWTKRATTKTICWTITRDEDASGHNLQEGIVSGKTLKELKLKLAQEGFSKK